MTSAYKFASGFDVSEGGSVRTDCPECGSKNTFTMTKLNGVLIYNCYKLACRARGYTNVGMTAEEVKLRLASHNDSKSKKAVAEILVWPEYVVQPSTEHKLLRRFINRWGLETEDLLYDVKDRRAVFPIKKDGITIDGVGRALDGAVPKWLRYTGNATVFSRVFGCPNGVVVLVEDVISAIVTAQTCPGVTGMAILGTSLSMDHMDSIGEYDTIVVALDPDAAHKTLQYKREIQSWTGRNTIALRLEDDLKYRVEEDMQKLEALL